MDLARIDKLATCLRERPLLPAHPEDPSRVWAETNSGVCLPLAHCAFKGCTWNVQSHTRTSNGGLISHVRMLHYHLLRQHGEQFQAALGKEVQAEDWLDHYEEACKV